MENTFYADAMGFLAKQGQPPIATVDLDLDLVHLTSAPPFATTTDEVLIAHDKFIHDVAQQGRFVVLRSKHDLEHVKGIGNGKTSVVYGLQNPPEDATPEGMGRLHDAGIRVMTIGYSGPNRYGSGFLDPYAPLTEDGEKLIKMIAETGMILDLSHAGHQTAWDTLVYIEQEMSRMPVMASHGGCYGVAGCYNPRNLPEEVLRKIILMGGVVGLYTLTFGLHPSDDGFDPFFNHLHKAISICGEDGVVLGTDGVYQRQSLDDWQKHHIWMMKNVPNATAMRARWPDQPFLLNYPDRMHVIENVIAGRGFPQAKIEKIMGRNFLEFLRRSL